MTDLLPRRTIPMTEPRGRVAPSYIRGSVEYRQEDEVVLLGEIPANSFISQVYVYVTTAFDDGEESPTATIDVGPAANEDSWVDGGDITSAGIVAATALASATDRVLSGNTKVYAEVNGDGENALTAGEVTVIFEFFPAT